MRNIPKKILKTLDEIRKNENKYVEIKVIDNRFFVYRSTSEWDKATKKVRKISEYIGTITSDGLFIPKNTNNYQESKSEVLEYGNCVLAHEMLKDLEPILKDEFPYYRELMALAIIKAIGDPKPIRLMESRYEKLYISKERIDLSPKHVSMILEDVGKQVESWYRVFSKLTSKEGILLYDMTTLFSYSKQIKLAEKGYNAEHMYTDQINVVLAFSTVTGLPVGIEVFYGSIKDINTIRDFLNRFRGMEITIVLLMDRGFYSSRLLRELKKLNIHYIIPFRKNSTLYIKNIKFNGLFKYRKRMIRSSKIRKNSNNIYYFYDPLLRGEEESSLLRRVEEKEITIDKYEQMSKVCGIIGIITDLELADKELFDAYKGREDIEQAFDAMKNYLDSDKTYLQTPESIRGFFFVTFLSLIIYFKTLKRLKERKVSAKISVEEVYYELSKVEKIIERTGREYFAAIPKRAKKMILNFSDMIPMG